MVNKILDYYGLVIEDLVNIVSEIDEIDPKMEFMNDLGKLSENYKDEFKDKFKFFKDTYDGTCLNKENTKEDNRIKGKALEDLVKLLFESSGGFFECSENLHTGTNEIDLLVKGTGRFNLFSKHLNDKYKMMICECKNHNRKINVGYVGKFYSLVSCSSLNIGILFSHDGLAGTGKWNSSKGLVRKIYLLNPNNRTYILDFCISDFDRYLNGESLIKILDSKCEELELDVDFSNCIKKHSKQDEICNKISKAMSK